MTIPFTAPKALVFCGAVLAAAAVTGCREDLLTGDNPPNVLVVDNLYASRAGFEQALNALYAQARAEHLGRADGGNDLRTDFYSLGTDAVWSPYRDPYTDVFNTYGVASNSSAEWFEDMWAWLYATVNGANTIIDRSETANIDWTPAQRDEIVGEARLFRAWAYRHLTYLWGDVPLNLHESTGANIRTDWVRSPKDSVLMQIEGDLLFAEAHLPGVADDGRLSSAVASHYLAELYLEMGNPATAEAEARKVTDAGTYQLVTHRYGVEASQPGTPFTDMFLDGNVTRSEGNSEVLWSFNYAPNVPGGGQSIMRREWVNRYYSIKGVSVTEENGGRGIGRMAPTTWALNLYAPADDRGSGYAIRTFYVYDDAANVPKGASVGDTVYTHTVTEKASDPMYASTRKWDGPDALDVNGSYAEHDEVYIRLAETYLLLAEAQFKQGNASGAAATINLLRARAHGPLVTAADVNMHFILDERERELMGEEQRRYTLLRTGTLLERTQQYNPIAGKTIAPRDTLFPIPQAVIDANIGHPMPQNPGF